MIIVSIAEFSKHAFAAFQVVTLQVAATCRIASVNVENHMMPFGHNLTTMHDAIDYNARVIFLANSNDPTGTYLKAKELEDFLQSIPDSIIVLIDEAYFQYVEAGDYPDSTKWVSRFDNIIVTRSFSKAYGLAGLRIGYALSNKKITDLFVSISVISQAMFSNN